MIAQRPGFFCSPSAGCTRWSDLALAGLVRALGSIILEAYTRALY